MTDTHTDTHTNTHRQIYIMSMHSIGQTKKKRTQWHDTANTVVADYIHTGIYDHLA